MKFILRIARKPENNFHRD